MKCQTKAVIIRLCTMSGIFYKIQCCTAPAQLGIQGGITDKMPFPVGLSVNFWPLWRWLTDKSSIFIDVSVNGSDFEKCRSSPLLFLERLHTHWQLFGVPADYGHILKIAILPVTGERLLRANPRNRHFARNRGAAFTGRFQKSTFCP